MALGSFGGLRTLTLESRRANEICKLIRTYGGEPFSAPSMRELPLDSNQPILQFVKELMSGSYDLVVFTTGVGVRQLVQIATAHFDREAFLSALRSVRIAVRGPKSTAALRELNIVPAIVADEPFTWRSLLAAIQARLGSAIKDMHIAIQEYGAPNAEMLSAFAEKNISVTRVPVYQWALPENTGPLREAILALAQKQMDVVLFLNAVQAVHLFQVADEMSQTDAMRDGLRTAVIGSIGPSTTEALVSFDIQPDYEPTQSRMGFLVNELASRAAGILEEKRRAAISDSHSKPPSEAIPS